MPNDKSDHALRLSSILPSLDGVRGIAIILVLVHQFGALETPVGFVAYVFANVVTFGWSGVQLFFVLSGFLITGILLDTRKSSNYYSGFFTRRGLRIFPLDCGVLFVSYVVLPSIGETSLRLERDLSNQIWLWTYLDNWLVPLGLSSKTFPHFWSLAIEEQFYLVWPFLMRSRNPQQCLRLCLYVAAISIVLRCILELFDAQSEVYYYLTFCRMDALALGGAAAAALRIESWRARLIAIHNQLLVFALAIFIVGLVLTRGYSLQTILGQTVGYTLLATTFSLMIMAAAGGDAVQARGWCAALRFSPLRIIGRYSYGMYVFHKPVHDFLGKPALVILGWDNARSACDSAAYVLLASAVVFVLAFFSYHLFEKHFLRMKRRLAPRQEIPQIQ